MDKYIEEFKGYLNQLSDAELEEVVSFYSEYLADGGFESYEDSVEELGSPRQLARKVLADYSIRLLDAPEKEGQTMRSRAAQSKTQVKTIWLIVLAILSTPLTIPLAIGVLATLFGLLVGAAAIVFALVVTILSLAVAGIFVFGVGVGIMAQSMSTGLVYVGAGLCVIGLFVALIPAFKWLISGAIHVTLSASRWLYGKLKSKNQAEKERGHK
ncbi:hypothetical protein IWT140_02050 [Secundilactobacillus pentosiphilus]|uniref:Integral membrane protein n=1 Tax=Secundilactobacillus pentosiphilus TaxID=1714682 RepID=A0A1Z5IS50_9LACO|nr:DUF1700 domain-containing protein [Secundilactobacillus pentosiphilus]GAX04412.1 hypothetical protein IWT140_02050 [Secundilactobacillus pentosiphilus]